MTLLRNLFLIGMFSLLSGCKTWNASMIQAPRTPIKPMLLTLERIPVERASMLAAADNSLLFASQFSDEVNLFTQELERNLMDPYADKYGYIEFRPYVVDARYGIGQLIFSALLFTLPNLFGMPFMHIRFNLSLEVRIQDRDKKLLASYTGTGTSSVKVAYYSGYSLRNSNALRKSYSDALIDALNKVRPRIQIDAESINQRLQQAGKLIPRP
jgi:hypothetical protein